MNIGQSIIEALESLNANRLRSGLTILGIIIGVGAVIAMLSVGQGAQATITSAISGIGTNVLFVFSGNQTEDVRNPRPLTLADAQALFDPLLAPDVEAVAPSIQGRPGITSPSGKQSNNMIIGATPAYFSMQNYTVTEGNVITEENELGNASAEVELAIGHGFVAVLHLPGLRGALGNRGDQFVDVEPGLLCEMQPF